MIKPTVGRVVWFHPALTEPCARIGDQPLVAFIVGVWGDECINIAGYDANGVPFARTSVYLFQGEEGHIKPSSQYAEWMPYQVGQAKKHEEPK